MIRPFGEAAALVEVEGPGRAQALAADLRADPISGVVAAVPGLRSVLVETDPLVVTAQAVEQEVAARLERLARPTTPGRLRAIPVVYGGEHGPDLDEVARLAGISADAVVELHLSSELRVLFGGFAPGFAYLGDLPPEIRVPRLDTPRTTTPRGSVAVAGEMSGIYPAQLPGGWRIIGRTPIDLFDPRRDPPAYLVPGDRVRFERLDAAEWDLRSGPPADW